MVIPTLPMRMKSGMKVTPGEIVDVALFLPQNATYFYITK